MLAANMNDRSALNDALCCHPHCAICTWEFAIGECIVMFQTDDQILRTKYVPCVGECSHPDGVAAATCHSSCHTYAGTPSRQLCLATCPDFDPRPTESIATDPTISLDSKLMENKEYPFPQELCQIIIKHLVRPICAAYSDLSSLEASEPSKVVVDHSAPIWAKFRKFHGRVYISSLTNLRSGSKGECRVYNPTSPSDMATNVVYIAYDAWGIRRIVYARLHSEMDINAHKGIWWRTLPLTKFNTRMLVESDGLKLRNISFQGKAHLEETSRATWDTPLSLHTSPTFYDLIPSDRPARYITCRINDCKASGYSFDRDSNKLIAHKPDEDTSYYKTSFSRNRFSLWIYMPVEPEEWVSRIWIRRGRTHLDLALVLGTSKGRIRVMGYHARGFRGQSYTYQQIAALGREPCRLFFDANTGIERLAITTARPSTQELPRLPRPLSSYPRCSSAEIFCYSAMRLGSVFEVRLCQVGEMITGMLMSDSTGVQDSIGQIRLDALLPPVKTHKSLGLWIIMARSLDHVTFVSDVEFDPPVQKSGKWIKIPWNGSLEWWFSGRQCRVLHNGKELVP